MSRDALLRTCLPAAILVAVLGLPGVAPAEDKEGAAGVEQLLDRIEKAHAEHDLKLLDEQCLDKDALTIVEVGPSEDRKALVVPRDRVLGMVEELAWKQKGLVSRRKTQRDITVTGSLAWMRVTTVDRYKAGAMAEFRDLYAAYRRDGTWRICLAMPDLFRPAMLVAQGDAGLESGDVVIAVGKHQVDTLAGGQAAFEQVAARKDGDPPVELTILRNGRELRVPLAPQSSKARIEPRLVPAGAGRLLGDDESHPVKDLTRSGIEMARKPQSDDFAKSLCPDGFLAITVLPGGQASLSNREAAIAAFRQSMQASQNTIDWENTKITRCRVITDGHVALGGATVSLAMKNGQQRTAPTRVQVFVRQGDKWLVAVNLGHRAFLGLDTP
ncbi:MAG: hypothetical protein BWX88_00068 [Planctomycetes bacterium ADurb.Bin126]|nr:MAG: hypothetical protein BWX88_00068 [Planctomycetes bacterium ADurb.Bin126]HOD81935.1 hypothetical protein [Phycisphaerae bacterium]HQL74150.1 hypothetical protein [Phycisphaerae bacterium]